MPIEWSKPPVHADLALSEGIDLGTQGDAAVRIGRLFEKTDQIDVAALHGGLVDQAMRECLGNVAHAQAQSQGQCADACAGCRCVLAAGRPIFQCGAQPRFQHRTLVKRGRAQCCAKVAQGLYSLGDGAFHRERMDTPAEKPMCPLDFV